MNVLIVDGNDLESSNSLREVGMKTQYEEYSDILKKLSTIKINIQIIHPAITENFLPSSINLDDFNGVVWTGSTLNIYDNTPAIYRQIELAKLLLSKKNKIFGSCWGLQVLSTAAGGVVEKNIKGLEAVISKKIMLNENGLTHQMYKNKKNNFDAFCWHYDEVKTIPGNSTILASNEHSFVQALTFHRDNSEFWGVQYHPEFSPNWIVGLMKLRKENLLEKDIYKNENHFNEMIQSLENIADNNNIFIKNIHDNIKDYNSHTLELKNWINSINSTI